MALHRTGGELEPVRGTGGAGTRLLRPATSAPVATGTFACPGCDAPGYLHRAYTPAEPYRCGYCGHEAPAREFLTLGGTVRPARVTVRIRVARP